ncbi:MAG: glutamate synthase subunit beta [Phycisphaerae bacterium]
MADPTGFIEYERVEPAHRGVGERLRDYRELDLPLADDELLRQAARCMDCGVPYCHGTGCPVLNRIPEFNDLIYRGRWRAAAENLHLTNNFPEITGRICPAPCEAACTLDINDDAVTIKHIELRIAERAFAEGWVEPRPARRGTDKHVAVIGSGPAGLAAAQQLARAGHRVTVFEKDERPGGLLRYGIPDFKLDKVVLDRRLEQMRAEGVEFQAGVLVGEDISPRYLHRMFDAVCLAVGAGSPRDLTVPGRGLEGIHFAMEYLTRQNRTVSGELPADAGEPISARGKVVAVIGGGDTGSDCVGTANRQGAREVHQLEILPEPPQRRPPDTPWPLWPRILRTSSSQEEGCHRRWSVMTRSFSGRDVYVGELHACEVDWTEGPDGWRMKPRPGTDFSMKVDLVLLAMGFVHVMHAGLVDALGVELDRRRNVVVDENCMTSREGVFAAGDAVEGASLVVRAIHAGRQAAAAIDRWLRK